MSLPTTYLLTHSYSLTHSLTHSLTNYDPSPFTGTGSISPAPVSYLIKRKTDPTQCLTVATGHNHTVMHTLSLSHSHTHAHTHARTHARTHSLTLSLTLTLTRLHAITHARCLCQAIHKMFSCFYGSDTRALTATLKRTLTL